MTSHRALPNSPESEAHILGCVLIEPAALATLADLPATAFFEPANRTIYGHLTRLHGLNGTGPGVSMEVLRAELQQAGDLEPVGGDTYLSHLLSVGTTTLQLPYFVSRVREMADLRSLIRLSESTIARAYEASTPDDLAELLKHATAGLDRLKPAPPTAAEAPKLSMWSPAQLRDYVAPEGMNLLGAGYLRRRELTTLIGPPGVGKSRLARWLAVSHIAGREFLGLPTAGAPARWLMIGNEDSQMRQKSDLEWFFKSLTPAEQAVVDTNLFMHVLETVDDGMISLEDPRCVQRMGNTIRHIQPDVVTFDPWANMIAGDEKSNLDVRNSVRLLLGMVRQNAPNAAILVIHHARTGVGTVAQAANGFSGGDLSRGAKSLVSAARCELALWAGSSDDRSRLVLTCEKSNNVEAFQPIGVVFENGIYRTDAEFSLTGWRDDIAGKRSGKTLTIEDLVAAVRIGRNTTALIGEWAAANVGASRPTIFRRLKEAVDKGWLAKPERDGCFKLGPKALAAQPVSRQYQDD